MIFTLSPWSKFSLVVWCVPRNLGLGLLLLQTGSASALRRRRRRRHKVEGQKSVALEKFIIIWQKLEKVAA